MENRVMDRHPNIKELYKATHHWGWVEGLYLADNDDGIAIRLLHGYEYEPQSRKLWRSLCAGAEMVIDVGAHSGVYSLDAWKAGAQNVLSVEPYHLNYARLLMNLRHAGFECGGTVFCAAGETNGVGCFKVNHGSYRHYLSSGGRLGRVEGIALEAGMGAEFPVFIRRLDDILVPELHSKVTVVKIDTEKNGVKVLNGMPHILSYKPDLILECIEEGIAEPLKALGYRFYRINETSGLEPVDDLTPDEPFTFDSPNRFASVKDLP